MRHHWLFSLAVCFGCGLTAVDSIVHPPVTLEKADWTKLAAYTPCSFPRPGNRQFNLHCQTQYHSLDYLCDPSGMLSRTEAMLIHPLVDNNFTSCRCPGPCGATRSNARQPYRIAIAVVPRATLNPSDDLSCPLRELTGFGDSLPNRRLYAELLAERWDRVCEPDLLIVVLLKWKSFNALMFPTIVPLYKRKLSLLSRIGALSHLLRFEHAEQTASRLRRYLYIVSEVLAQRRPIPGSAAYFDPDKPPGRLLTGLPYLNNRKVPQWAIYLGVCMLAMAAFCTLIGHCITICVPLRRPKRSQPTTISTTGGTTATTPGDLRTGLTGSSILSPVAHSITEAVSVKSPLSRGQSLRQASLRWKASVISRRTAKAAGLMSAIGNGGGEGGRTTRSTMMFRQFSRKSHQSVKLGHNQFV